MPLKQNHNQRQNLKKVLQKKTKLRRQESAGQQGPELNILTSNQILNRLPISL